VPAWRLGCQDWIQWRRQIAPLGLNRAGLFFCATRPESRLQLVSVKTSATAESPKTLTFNDARRHPLPLQLTENANESQPSKLTVESCRAYIPRRQALPVAGR
jgi:hypothetical protein